MSKEPRLTAAQARIISGPTIHEIVDEALEHIKAAAEKKERSCNLHDNFWTNEGYRNSKEYAEAKTQLMSLGYEVEFFYEELQFVNMYTIVRW